MAKPSTGLNRLALESLCRSVAENAEGIAAEAPETEDLRAELASLSAPCRERVEFYMLGVIDTENAVAIEEDLAGKALANALRLEIPGRSVSEGLEGLARDRRDRDLEKLVRMFKVVVRKGDVLVGVATVLGLAVLLVKELTR